MGSCQVTRLLAGKRTALPLGSCRRAFPAADPPIFDYHNLIAIPNRAQAVRDNQETAAAAPQIVVYRFLRARIERAGGFVENQNAD